MIFLEIIRKILKIIKITDREGEIGQRNPTPKLILTMTQRPIPKAVTTLIKIKRAFQQKFTLIWRKNWKKMEINWPKVICQNQKKNQNPKMMLTF